MKREHPFFSKIGIILTVIFLTGFALLTWRTGGMAFSPGRLSAKDNNGASIEGFNSHVEFESECRRCHAPLTTTMDKLCMECHTNIAEQIANVSGMHGNIELVNQCSNCHLDHQGEGYDMVAEATKNFDHSTTDFSLLNHQIDFKMRVIACGDCHNRQNFSSEIETGCTECHENDDPVYMTQHVSDFGMNCLACHDGVDKMTQFDHSTTNFKIDGMHLDLDCANCHSQDKLADYPLNSSSMLSNTFSAEMFKNIPNYCEGCHQEPEVHRGVFSNQCVDCHKTSGWAPALWDGKEFIHSLDTNFSLTKHELDYRGQVITCSSCHQGDIYAFDDQGCIDCHSDGVDNAEFTQLHIQQYGMNCTTCHDGVDRMEDFDHQRVFPLEGAHTELDCLVCHTDQVFSGTPRECSQCHAEPDIHAGFFGLNCQNCHSSSAWTPATLRFHNFPLDHGGQGVVECATCHTVSYLTYSCYGCHEHQPAEIQEEHFEEGISLNELENCVSCHPTGLEDED